MLKQVFIAILFLVTTVSLMAESLKDYFPKEIEYQPVLLYLHEKKYQTAAWSIMNTYTY